MMKCVWLQFRKDVRQHQNLFLLWGLMLLLDLVTNLGWGMGFEFIIEGGGFSFGYAVKGLLTFVLWLMFLSLPALVVLADSPAKQDGFLATRPLSRRHLYLAKLLVVLLVGVMPVLIQEAIYLGLRGASWAVGIQGVWERGLFALPMVLVAATYAALWASVRGWTTALFVTGALGWLAGIAVAFLSQVGWVQSLPGIGGVNFNKVFSGDQRASFYLVWLLAAVMLLGWIAWLNHRSHWSIRRRSLALGMALAAVTLISLIFPVNLFPIHGAQQETVDQGDLRETFRVPLRGLSYSGYEDAFNRSRQKVSVSVRPRLQGLPDHWSVDWRCREAALHWGNRIVPLQGTDRTQSDIYGWQSNYRGQSLRAIRSQLPQPVVFVTQAGGQVSISTSEHLGLFTLPADEATAVRRFDISYELEGRVFQWSQFADLPLEPDAEESQGLVKFRIISVRQARPDYLQVILQLEQPALGTSSDPTKRHKAYWPHTEYQLALYEPAKGVIWVPNNISIVSWKLGAFTAMPSTLMHAVFEGNEMALKGPLTSGECRLLAFRREYLGKIQVQHESNNLPVTDLDWRDNLNDALNDSRLTYGQFIQRQREVDPPGEEATDVEMGRYLSDVFQLLDANRIYLSSDDPFISVLAKWVPRHLDLFLRGLPVCRHESRRAILHALIRGLLDSQKADIFTALDDCHDLAEVILARGWMEEGRPALIRQLESSRYLPMALVRAVAWLEDPETYPRLLAELTANPQLELYEVLRVLPGIEKGMEEALAVLENGRLSVWNVHGSVSPATPVLIRHGNQNTFEDTWRLFRLIPSDRYSQFYGLIDALRNNVNLEEITPRNRHDQQAVGEILRQYQTSDFRYHPIRRRYVLTQP